MDTKQLERIDYLLRSNEVMCNGLLFGDYGERNSDSFKGAREACRKNLKEIREILGLPELRKQQAIDSWLETCKGIMDNLDYVAQFMDTVKTEAKDLEWNNTNRQYTLNKETGKFDVIEEKLETPERRILSDLEDQTYSRDEWHDVIKDFAPEWGHDKNIFDEDLIAAAYAFMVGPVSIQKKKVISAESRKYSSFEELKENILTEAKEKDMVLYMTYAYLVADPRDINKTTFTVTENYPKITMYCWRGAFLDKE